MIQNKRHIYLWGDFTAKMAYRIIRQLRKFGEQPDLPCYIFIHTDGGDGDALLSVVDEMAIWQNKGMTINTIAHGKAYSAGAYILSMGTYGNRYATSSATIMFHDFFSEHSDEMTKQQAYMEHFKKNFAKFIKKIAYNCNYTTAKQQEKFKQDMLATKYFTTDEAIKYGVIDKLWSGEN